VRATRILALVALLVALAWVPPALEALGVIQTRTSAEPGGAEAWARRGDEAFAAGRLPEATRAFTYAFRLTDPTDEMREVRAVLAFRKARSLAEQALTGQSEWPPAALADGAFFWLEQARTLGPSLRAVTYEQARLFDSDIEGVADPERARVEYARYVAETEAAGDVPEAERERLARARERLGALSEQAGG